MKLTSRRTLRLLSAGLLLLPLIIGGQVTAQDCSGNDCSTDSSTLFGQTQSYDVLLRGNGEAVVNARMGVANHGSQPLSSLSYSIVSGNLEDVTAFQQISCSALPILEPFGPTSSGTGASGSAGLTPVSPNPYAPIYPPTNTNTVTSTALPECYAGLAEHPLNSSSEQALYYPFSSDIYKQATVQKSNNSFTLTLAQPVSANQTTTIVMAYNLSGVTRRSLGVFHYDFKTLKAGTVSDVTVSVSVDENYFLADAANGNVNYRPVPSSGLSANLDAGSSLNVTNGALAQVNNYVDSIGNNGNVTKHASSLAAGETYTVKGRFATSTFLLNWPRTVFRWAIVVVIVLLLAWWYRRNRKRLQGQPINSSVGDENKVKKTPSKVEEADAEGSKAAAAFTARPVSTRVQALPFYGLISGIWRHMQERRIRPMVFAWLCGFLTIVLIGGVVYGFSAISNYSNNSYGNTGTVSTFLPALSITIGAIGFLGFLFFTIGLPILYAGSFRRAVRIFVHLFIFFFIALLVLVTLLTRLNNTDNVAPGCIDYCGGGITNAL